MFKYTDNPHGYFLDEVPIPSLTQMLGADGLDEHLSLAHPGVVKAKAEWGTGLATALLKAEYGFGVDANYKQQCVDWLDTLRKMGWGYVSDHIWKNAEVPALCRYEGFVFGFTPDRAAPEAVVEIKGTYSPQVSHGIQTALQVIGMGYARDTARFVAYFDKQRMTKLIKCDPTVKRNGQAIDVYAEAERIVFERGLFWEGK